jgi:hypothetical protein
MTETFKLGDKFIEFIKTLKFKFYPTETSIKYYTNPNGKQIKTDREGNITLLDCFGNSLVTKQSFKKSEILNHI